MPHTTQTTQVSHHEQAKESNGLNEFTLYPQSYLITKLEETSSSNRLRTHRTLIGSFITTFSDLRLITAILLAYAQKG